MKNSAASSMERAQSCGSERVEGRELRVEGFCVLTPLDSGLWTLDSIVTARAWSLSRSPAQAEQGTTSMYFSSCRRRMGLFDFV